MLTCTFVEDGLLCEVTITLHEDTVEHGDDVLAGLRTYVSNNASLEKVNSSPSQLRAWIPMRLLDTVAAMDHVAGVHPAVDMENLITEARKLIQSHEAPQTGVWGSLMRWVSWLVDADQRYQGQGEIIAIADTGLDKASWPMDPHPAFAGRIANTLTTQALVPEDPLEKLDDADNVSHGTHVAGCAVGKLQLVKSSNPYFSSSSVLGTAPKAQVYIQKHSDRLSGKADHSFYNMITNIQTNHTNIKIHNNSWGPLKSDLVQITYAGSEALEIDKCMYTDPQMLVLFAAGNAGLYPKNKTSTTRGVNRQVGGVQAAKNCLTVGASWSTRDMAYQAFSMVPKYEELYCTDGDLNRATNSPGSGKEDPKSVPGFSSKGPTCEGFLKPDVVAPGVGILSAFSRHDTPQGNKPQVLKDNGTSDLNACFFPELTFASGTSMATPAVAGIAACLREASRSKHVTPAQGPTLKAMLVNGAVSCKGKSMYYFTHAEDLDDETLTRGVLEDPPDCIQGHGEVDLKRSLRHILEKQFTANKGHGHTGYYEAGSPAADGIAHNQTWPDDLPEASRFNAYIYPRSTDRNLRVTLVYNDSHGSTLQFDLKLKVVQEAVNTTTKKARQLDSKIPQVPHIYPVIDGGTAVVRLGNVQKVTWLDYQRSGLQSGEQLRFKMVVETGTFAIPDVTMKFSLCWLSE